MSTTAVYNLPNGRSKMRLRDMSTVAQDFRTALSKCDHLVAYGKHREALEVMVQSLQVDRTRRRDGQKAWKLRKWADVKDPFQELFRLAFSVRDNDLLFSMWSNLAVIRENMRGNSGADEMWSCMTQEIRVQLSALIADANNLTQREVLKATPELNVVALLSGRTNEQLVKARFDMDGFVANVITRCISTRFIGTSSVAALRLVLETVESFSTIVLENNFVYASTVLSRSLTQYLESFLFNSLTEYASESGRNQRSNENTRLLRQARTIFFEELPNMERTFHVLSLVREVMQTLGQWQQLTDVVVMTIRILLEFPSEAKQDHWPLIISVYKSLGDVFLRNDIRTYHALALTRAASFQQRLSRAYDKDKDKQQAALQTSTAAVLACLAAPDVSNGRNQFRSNDSDFRRLSTIAELFKMIFPPSRASLCHDLVTSGVVLSAHPAAQELLTLLATDNITTSDVCSRTQAALETLQSVVNVPDFNAAFSTEIRRVGLTKHFLAVAETSSSIQLRSLQDQVHFSGTADDAYQRVLNILLDDLNVPVLIDQGDDTITFTSASLSRINKTFTQLAEIATPAKAPIASKRAPILVGLEDLEIEANRVVSFHGLVHQRLNANRDLKEARIRYLRESKDKKKQAVVDLEKDRQKAQADANTKRMAKEYQVAELRERRKLLIHRLQEKHKGLKISPDVVELNQQSFLDNLTMALTEFQRRIDTVKRSDVRRMDYFERACRERDIPKRQELAESMASELEAERVERWQNFLAQHKLEHEAKKATRERLLKFVSHAAKYEQQLSERTTKTTKRDEQEDNLRAEKERLAAMAAQAAPAPNPAPAAAAPNPAAPAPPPAAAPATPGDLPAPVAGQKWAPRPRPPKD